MIQIPGNVDCCRSFVLKKKITGAIQNSACCAFLTSKGKDALQYPLCLAINNQLEHLLEIEPPNFLLVVRTTDLGTCPLRTVGRVAFLKAKVALYSFFR
jgi:hypothetical protein